MDEYEIIALLTEVAGKLPPGYAPIGDDVAAIETSPGKLILKADMLVAKTDVPPGMTWRQVGRKSVAMCVSDFASKGIRPRAFLISLGIPRGMRGRGIQSLVSGFRDSIEEWGVRLVGGDTNESEGLVVDCVLTGFADNFVSRGGARPGELLIVTGEFGVTSAGLKILLQNAACSSGVLRRRAVRNVYHPMPKLALGIALRDYLSAAMDSSDGLAICLHTLAEASGVGMRIDRLPYPEEVEEFAAENGYSLEELVLYGGEEYEIVGTIPKGKLARAQRIARSKNSELIVIGETTESKGVIETSSGRPILKKGWIQLGPKPRQPSRPSRTS